MVSSPALRYAQSIFYRRGHPHHLLARSPVCKFTFENRKTPDISRTVRFRGDFGRFYLIWLYGGGEARYLLLCGNRKAPHRCGAFALPGRWSEGLFSYLLCFFLLATTAVPMAALPLTSIRTTSKAGLLVSPVCGMVY